MSYIQTQKFNFRKQVFIENNDQVLEIKVLANDIFINRSGFEWRENNKELLIGGLYYEVISITKVKDFYTVKVVSDKKENKLFQNYFCLNKATHKYYIDFIRLLLGFNYLTANSTNCIVFQPLNRIKQLHNDFRFLTYHYFHKKIKPPQQA